MDAPLDEQYLTWLYARIGSVKETRKSETYWNIFRLLYNKEFEWKIPNDDNRVEDGRDLRYQFLTETDQENVDPNWVGMGCSVLELMMSLAHVLAFDTDRTNRSCFFELLGNLGFDQYNDAAIFDLEEIEDVLNGFIQRKYRPNGRGGLFPLRSFDEDQRAVELWQQLNSYVLERY